MLQEATSLYRDGDYSAAIAKIEQAEPLLPNFPTLWLNKGFTCRQMIVPGAESPENKRAAACATAAFKRYQELAPQDPRGENLYVQTLFDTNQFDALSSMYEARFNANPRDMDAVLGLIQTYTKANKFEEALQWYTKRAEISAKDPEVHYAVGVYIYQQLAQRGGGPDKQAYIPAGAGEVSKEAAAAVPGFAVGDIVSMQRIDMADLGIGHLKKAIELRPTYHEAMTYLGLLYRQKSFAHFTDAPAWRLAVDEAEKWRRASLAAQGKPVAAAPVAAAPVAPGSAPSAPVAAAAASGKQAKAKAKGKAKAKAKARATKAASRRQAKRARGK